jgi:hypothetical protein
MIPYDGRAVITRPSGAGTQDPATGAYTPPAATTVYDGACDAQDVARVLRRDAAGIPTLVADAQVYLPWTSWPAVREEDRVALTFADGAQVQCRVLGLRRLDRVIYVGS